MQDIKKGNIWLADIQKMRYIYLCISNMHLILNYGFKINYHMYVY